MPKDREIAYLGEHVEGLRACNDVIDLDKTRLDAKAQRGGLSTLFFCFDSTAIPSATRSRIAPFRLSLLGCGGARFYVTSGTDTRVGESAL